MKRMVILSLCLMLGWLAFMPPAQAKFGLDKLMLFKEKITENPDKKLEAAGYPPPAVGAEDAQCGALRNRIRRLNQKPSYLYLFYRPWAGVLQERHYQCVSAIHHQQFLYLKHVQVEDAEEIRNLPPLEPAGGGYSE